MNSIKISHTAAYIAVKFYGLTKDPKLKPLFSEDILNFYEQMVRFLPRHLSWYHDSLDAPFWRKFFIFSEELLLPGDLMHIISRKYYMNRMLQKALNEGYEQLVVLGAGFDHQAAITSKQGIPSFELDMEVMIDQKNRFYDQNGYTNENLHLQSVNLTRQSLSESLLSFPEFDKKRRTIFLAEGFFDYLSLTPGERVLTDIKALNPNNRLISTFFSLDELNIFHRFVFTSGVSLVGESLKFKLIKEEFVDFLEEIGFSVSEEITKADIKREFLKPNKIKLPVLNGFYLFSFD
ncbi:MAG TPA: hypothetical protein DEQ34_00300 [Balneolaceae bacterium]|nr:hypothetical protein [Balneolaceae bacterium]|tara:strand:+ start:183896 stop:184771 length:876 start_codon:yes stop_codon:yes gene_type:complete